MRYVVSGLDPARFSRFGSLNDDLLRSVGGRRVIADARPGYSCRVSLEDADVGERQLLLPIAHHEADRPCSASGPFFIRKRAVKQAQLIDELPEQLRIRLLSIRAYEANGDLIEAEVVEGTVAEPVVRQFLERADVAFLHVHFARRGCYAARIERAEAG